MEGSMASQAEEAVESLHLIHKHEAEREAEKSKLALAWAFETLEPTLHDIAPPTRPNLFQAFPPTGR